MLLPDRESNPGLPRDRRRSSPLDYRGLLWVSVQDPKETSPNHFVKVLMSLFAILEKKKGIMWIKCFPLTFSKREKNEKRILLRAGFEPATYGLLLWLPTTVHRSTNWAIEGLMNSLFTAKFILWRAVTFHPACLCSDPDRPLLNKIFICWLQLLGALMLYRGRSSDGRALA